MLESHWAHLYIDHPTTLALLAPGLTIEALFGQIDLEVLGRSSIRIFK
jgi:hypothetical protein